VLLGVAALTPVLAYLGNLGFAPLIALAGLLALPLLLRDRRPSLGQALLTALAVWAAASSLWSVVAPRDLSSYEGLESLTAVKLVLELALYGAFVAVAAAAARADGARAILVLALGLAALAVLFLGEAVFKAPLYRLIRAAAGQAQRPDWALRDVARVAYVLALLFWPVALRLEQARLRPVAFGLAAATVAGAFLLGADAPLAAMAASGLVFAAVLRLGRPAILALLAAVALYFAAAPLVLHAAAQLNPVHPAADDIRLMSWAIRLDIWRFAAERIAEKPFFGWGLDASRAFAPAIPLHPHNAVVQVWLELGVVGAGLAALFWAWLVTRIDALEARDRPMAAAAAAALTAYLVIGGLSFGVWQEWWLALGALTLAVCAALAAGRRPDPLPGEPAADPPG
jgi:O-antigen ligase